MPTLSVPAKILLSLLLGAFIGLERESYERLQEKGGSNVPKKFPGIGLGVRTFSLITSLGTIAGLLKAFDNQLSLVLSITFMTLVISSYILSSVLSKDIGMTTEIALIVSYLIGILVATEAFPIPLTVALTVILVLILSLKQSIRSFISGLERGEVTSFISYAIIAAVILPLLPNQWFSISDIPGASLILTNYGIQISPILKTPLVNPFTIWLVVAIVTGIDILGYFLERFLSEKKSWFITSLIGGFISSTTYTQHLSLKSIESKSVHRLVAASLVAFIGSFIQHFFAIGALNPSLLVYSTPFIVITITTALFLMMYFLKREKFISSMGIGHNQTGEMKLFSLKPALQFAALFLTINILVKICYAIFGNTGFFISLGLAAFTGMDSAIITISQLAGSEISYHTAILSLIIVNAVNLSAKTLFSLLQGSRRFTKLFGLSMLCIVLSSITALLFFTYK